MWPPPAAPVTEVPLTGDRPRRGGCRSHRGRRRTRLRSSRHSAPLRRRDARARPRFADCARRAPRRPTAPSPRPTSFPVAETPMAHIPALRASSMSLTVSPIFTAARVALKRNCSASCRHIHGCGRPPRTSSGESARRHRSYPLRLGAPDDDIEHRTRVSSRAAQPEPPRSQPFGEGRDPVDDLRMFFEDIQLQRHELGKEGADPPPHRDRRWSWPANARTLSASRGVCECDRA